MLLLVSIQEFLDKAGQGEIELPDHLIKEFKDSCETAIRKQFSRRDDVSLRILFSDDTGSSYETSNYETTFNYTNYGGSPASSGDTGAAMVMNDIGNASGEVGGFECTFPNLANTSLNKVCWFIGATQSNGGSLRTFRGAGLWKSTADVDALQFKMSSGTFSGTLKLYGIS